MDWCDHLKARPGGASAPAAPREFIKDWDPKMLSTALAGPDLHGDGPTPLQQTTSMSKQAPSGKLEKATWLCRRAGATQFEILQVSKLYQRRPFHDGTSTSGLHLKLEAVASELPLVCEHALSHVCDIKVVSQ